MTVILAQKNCIFEREGPRHPIIFITIKLNSKTIYSTLNLPAIKNWTPFSGVSATKKTPKLSETFAKVENRRVAKLPNCLSSFFFSEASSKLAQAMTVILARKNYIFECEGPRHHIIFITIKLNSRAIYSTLPSACH